MDLNKAMIIGRLTQDPELKSTQGGQSVCRFSIATNFSWSDGQGGRNERVEYHNVVAWRKLADICGQYLSKGKRVYVEGRLQTSSWDDQQGNKKYKTEIIVDNMIMLDGGTGTSGGSSSGQQSPKAQSSGDGADIENVMNKFSGQATKDEGKDDEIRIEDIPF